MGNNFIEISEKFKQEDKLFLAAFLVAVARPEGKDMKAMLETNLNSDLTQRYDEVYNLTRAIIALYNNKAL